jgi:hypothetical protein
MRNVCVWVCVYVCVCVYQEDDLTETRKEDFMEEERSVV